VSSSLAVLLEVKTTHSSAVLSLPLSQCFTPPLKSIPASFFPHAPCPPSWPVDPKSPSHPDTRTTHVSSVQDYICDSWCLSVHWPNMVGQFSWEGKTLEGRADPRRMSSESGRFSFRQECEVATCRWAGVIFWWGVCFFGKWTQSFLVGKEWTL